MDADPEIDALYPRLRAVISNAFYDARNAGRTMEHAADVAAAGCEEAVKAWLADHAARDLGLVDGNKLIDDLNDFLAGPRAVRGPHPHKVSDDGPAYDPGPGLAELARAESIPSEVDTIAMAMWAQSPNEPIADLEELPETLRAEFRRRAVGLRAQLLRMGWISPTGS